MKNAEAERARKDRDTVAIGSIVMVGGAVLLLLVLLVQLGSVLSLTGRALVVLTIAAITVLAAARHVRDHD